MDTLNLDLNKRYSYADYLTWKDDIRRELFDGFVKMMTPAPSWKHQELSFNHGGIFHRYLKNKPCNGAVAPIDVRLFTGERSKKDETVFTVVQTDFFIVCDLEKIDDRGCL